MLEKRYRFHSRGGVRYTYQKGKTLRTPRLSLVYNANPRGFLRFGVVISKKVIKSAVGRNRVRRRVYEAIRLELTTHPIPSGDFIFVIYHKDILTLPFAELQFTIHKLLEETSIAL